MYVVGAYILVERVRLKGTKLAKSMLVYRMCFFSGEIRYVIMFSA